MCVHMIFQPPPSLPPSPLPADCYLLQIQQYTAVPTTLKPKVEGATIKAEPGQSDTGVVAPATGQKEAIPQWYDIDVVKTTQYTVSGYQVPVETEENKQLGETPKTQKVELQPGKAYKFRVCAINSCGSGPFSDVAAFKTCMPGFPGAPSAIRISKVTHSPLNF